MKTNNIFIAGALVFLLTQASPVFAQGPRGLIEDVGRFERTANDASQKQEEKLERQKDNLKDLKIRADRAIDRRIDKLNKLLQRIQNDKKLSSDEKTSLSSDIQTDINGLNLLKSKIDSETDATAIKTDIKQITSNFKIFTIIEPKTRLLITIDKLQTVTDKILKFTPKIQGLINTLKSEGKDVAKLQGLLDDVSKRLNAIKGQLSSDKTLVLGVTVSTGDPKSVFTQVRKDLADVRQSFGQIRHDFAQMRETFRIIITGGNSGNGSASVSPSPTASPKI